MATDRLRQESPRDGFLFLDRDRFHASFAADLPADLAAFMADSQVPWGGRLRWSDQWPQRPGPAAVRGCAPSRRLVTLVSPLR
jgi:hypothetical protein